METSKSYPPATTQAEWEQRVEKLLTDAQFRRDYAHKSFLGFCMVYLPHYFYLEPPLYINELCEELSNTDTKLLEVVGFRGSTKSTLASTALVLWSALEHPDRYPFILPIGDTGTQSKATIASIKSELDYNELLKNDYGKPRYFRQTQEYAPDLESKEEWQSQNLLLNNGVRILARSRGQKVRGLKNNQHRPKLVIVDDPEDLEWVRQKENRNKTERWLTGEVLPALDERDGRMVLIGNWLHLDGIMARMKNTGLFKLLEYPLVKDGVIQWPAKWDEEKIMRTRALGDIAFRREYLLEVIPDEGQPIVPDDIHYYDKWPEGNELGLRGHGVDLAISEKDTADYTACVNGDVVYDDDEAPFIYIRPDVLNVRMDFAATIKSLVGINNTEGVHLFFVENVGYQQAAISELGRRMVPVVPMKALKNKRARLNAVAPLIKSGLVKFPRHGCEDLLAQLFGFGVEKHDDMVDALVYLIQGLREQGIDMPEIGELDI